LLPASRLRTGRLGRAWLAKASCECDHKEPDRNRLEELEERLDALTTVILLPLRASKYVDHAALDQLNNLVHDLVREISDAPTISRRLTGKLWFIFTQMLAQADHTRAPEEILSRAWTYQDRLEALFGPWFSRHQKSPKAPWTQPYRSAAQPRAPNRPT
jgi:hypothetical protein